MPFDGWKTQLQEFYDKAGALEGRKISKITWYQNPTGEKPGIYAATDFVGQFQNLSLQCGYVSWHQRMDGSFELVHEETNSIAKSVAVKMTPEMMQRAHATFGC